MIPFQKISIPFVGGMDEEIDEKALPVAKLKLLQDMYFRKTGALAKRPGNTALATAVHPSGGSLTASEGNCRALAAYKDDVVLLDRKNLYSYSPNLGRWVEKGQALTPQVKISKRFSGTKDIGQCDSATLNGVTVVACVDEHSATSNGDTLSVLAYEESTGLLLQERVRSTAVSSTAWAVRVVAFNSRIIVFWTEHSSGGTNYHIKALVINPTSAANLNTTITGGAATVVGGGAAGRQFDVAVESTASTQAFIAHTTSAAATTITFDLVDNAGALVGPGGTIVDGAAVKQMAVAVNGANHAIAWLRTGAASDVFCGVRSWNGAAWAVVATSTAIDTTLSANGAANVACIWDPSTNPNPTVRIFYTELSSGTPTEYLRRVHQSTFTTGGVQTARIGSLYHSTLTSKPFKYQNDFYCYAAYVSTLQPTQFLLRWPVAGNPTVCARILPGSYYAEHFDECLPQVIAFGSAGTAFAFAGIKQDRLDDRGQNAAYYNRNSAAVISVDFEALDTVRCIEVGESLYIPGGMLLQYDGDDVVEAGFPLFPEMSQVTSVKAAGGSMTSSATYSYKIYYKFTNARGELEVSSVAGAHLVTMGGTDTKVTLTIPTLAQTRKGDFVSIAVFRTLANGTVYYLVSDESPTVTGVNGYVSNDTINDTVSFEDRMSDATAATKQPDPYADGELDHIAPPAGHVIAAGAGRVFLSGFEDPNQVWYSKTRDPGLAVAFNDANLIQLDDDGGQITAMGLLNEALIVFKKRRIFEVLGDGQSNVPAIGQGYELPRLIASDTGCVNQRSVCPSPVGIFFQSEKGIYLLDQARQLHFIGAEVKDQLASFGNRVNYAILAPKLTQVRFGIGGPGLGTRVLVYDYRLQQWSYFSGLCEGAAVVGGVQYTARSTGSAFSIHKESAASWIDAGTQYDQKLVTAHVKLDGYLGFQRVRRLALLGVNYEDDIAGDVATIQMSVYLDGTFLKTWTYTTAGLALGQFEFRTGKLTTKKCSAIQVEVLVTTSGSSSGRGIELSGVELEAQLKPGIKRMTVAKTIA